MIGTSGLRVLGVSTNSYGVAIVGLGDTVILTPNEFRQLSVKSKNILGLELPKSEVPLISALFNLIVLLIGL